MISLRLGGFFMILGALLMLTRLIPIFANLPENFMGMPPANVDQLALLAVHNTSGWHLSHWMGLFALPFIWLGVFAHVQKFVEGGMPQRATVGLVGVTIGMLLFAMALFIDGFIVPYTSFEFMNPELLSKETAEFMVNYSHKLGLTFFTPGLLSLLVGFGLLSSPIAHGLVHNRWFGYVGLFLANLGVVGHIFGWTGENFNKMPLGGIVMMGLFLWLFLLGIAAVRQDKKKKTS